tara:strand:+ start:611 stop:820 length:210 start_codon:yes stop_codon:yes gene_type:complete
MEELSYTGYLLMFCIMSFSLILCTILFQQDKRIKTYRLSELVKDRSSPKMEAGKFDKQGTVEYTKGDNT